MLKRLAQGRVVRGHRTTNQGTHHAQTAANNCAGSSAERAATNTAEATAKTTAEAGVSMVEMIVYMMLSLIVATAAGVILANTWKTQNSVTTTTQATNSGQSFGAAMERAVRNAIDLSLSADQQVLWVHTTLAGQQECQAFALVDGTLWMSQTTGPIPASPTATSHAGWAQWRNAVTGAYTDPATGLPVLFDPVVGGTGLEGAPAIVFAFNIATNGAPVHISGEAKPRTAYMGGVSSSPCWS
jgi:hypothetical protein